MAISEGSSAGATGIFAHEFQTDAQLVNFGTISVLAQSATGSGSAYGIYTQTLDGTVSHSGSISVHTEGASAGAYGIFVDTLNGTLDVTGDISVSGPGANYGIFLGSGTGALNIESRAQIDQKIRIADHDVNLTHVGESAVYQFEDANSVVGTFTTSRSSSTQAWFTDGVGGEAPTYAAVSSSGFQLNKAEFSRLQI